MAGMLFDQAWPRYPSVLEGLRGGAAPITPVAEQQLKAVAELLRPDNPVHIELLIYVGDLEDNAFTVAYEGQITTATQKIPQCRVERARQATAYRPLS
jgi:hypothetical protein